jgi:hypothetical protein
MRSRKCLVDFAAAEVLRLDVDEPVGALDGVDEQVLDFTDDVVFRSRVGAD